MLTFKEMLTSGNAQKALAKNLENAIKTALTMEYPDISVRVDTTRINVDPLIPAGWKLNFGVTANLAVLDKVKPPE